MLKEAKNPKYLLQGFNLRNYRQYPPGIDPHNLLNEQQIFLMYLAAVSPTFEDLRLQVSYLEELEKIQSATFGDFFDTKPSILKLRAKIKGVSPEIMQEQLLKPAKERAVDELRKKYGFESLKSDGDPRDLIREKYRKLSQSHMDSVKKISKEQEEKLRAAAQLFNLNPNAQL